MRDINELIANVTLRDEDYEHIEPLPFDDETYTNIVNSTLKGIEDIRTKNRTYTIKKKRTRILFIAATLTLSTAILATTRAKNIQEIFINIFGNNISNINNSGQIINTSVTDQGIELNLEGLVSDTNSLDLLFNIRKESGKPFIGENIYFEEFTIEILDTNSSFQAGITESTHCHQLDSINPNSTECRFRLTKTTIDAIKNGTAILRLANMIESEKHTIVSDLNLGKWLKENPQDITLIPNHDLRLKEITNKNRIAELNIPEQIITSTDANLQLFKDNHDIKVNSIAFINNKLHIKVSNSSNSLYFQDTNGNIFNPIYIASSGCDTYYVFDINTMEKLANLKAYANISRVVNTINGTWEIKFALDRQNEKMILQPNVVIPLSENGSLLVKEIQLSNLSLKLISNNFISRDIKNINIDINFKDNSDNLHLDGAYVSTFTDTNKSFIYKFDKPIDVSAVDTISINGQPISLE